MCGIFGILKRGHAKLDPALLEAAFRVQAHRGPDGSGVQTFRLEHSTLLFAHQRLAVIDLSDAALQPMDYRNGQGSLIFNGELYNYLELREELASAGESFATRSDTEVLLAALHVWGPERALTKFNWMGAFAWFDRPCARLVLACDAGSEKPLYYYTAEEQLIFASEIKTVLTLLGRRLVLDKDVVGRFIFQGLSDASTHTFFRDIRRLAAGSYAILTLTGEHQAVVPVRYQPPPYAQDPLRIPLPEFVEEVRRVLTDSVRMRLRSDVPIGVLLSGGVDSSSIAAISQVLLGREAAPQLLSVVSDDPRFDESKHIGKMEHFLGQTARKITLRIEPQTLEAELSVVNWFNDAPVAGLSALGHFKLMECAKHLGLTVILSGQGADEILLGYRKFLGFYLQSLVRRGHLAKAVAVLTGFVLNRTVVSQFNLGSAKRYLSVLRRMSDLLTGQKDESSFAGEWLHGWAAVPLGLGTGSLADRQMLDIRHYSVPSLCHYEDRMSMAWSREIRLPFLDTRLIDLLMRAPDNYKLRRGWTKYALRKAMQSSLPPEICWRKDKQGFSNPQGEWLKRELRAPVLDAFCADSLISRKGIVNSEHLLRTYERYCRQPADGGLIWYREIFAPFSLELWMRRYESWIA
jgi:asparagine synthase (glutamine-hydrolysing)